MDKCQLGFAIVTTFPDPRADRGIQVVRDANTTDRNHLAWYVQANQQTSILHMADKPGGILQDRVAEFTDFNEGGAASAANVPLIVDAFTTLHPPENNIPRPDIVAMLRNGGGQTAGLLTQAGTATNQAFQDMSLDIQRSVELKWGNGPWGGNA